MSGSEPARRQFPYREEGLPPGVTERPTLDAVVVGPNEAPWTCNALVDNGAHRTVFDRGTADAVGIRMGHAGSRRGKIRLLGADREVQLEYVSLAIAGWEEEEWTAGVGFITDPS